MKHKFVCIVSIVTVIVFFVYLLFYSESNLSEHKKLNLKIKELKESIASTKNQINNNYTFKELENDTAGKLEQYSREQLNLQRPGEDVYLVVYE